MQLIMDIDVRSARAEVRRIGSRVRNETPMLVNEAAARAAAEAFETTREAHKEDIERALNKTVTMAGGEEMPMAEAIVAARNPGISISERRSQAERLRKARLGARGFVRSGFAYALRDLNRVIRKPIKLRTKVKMGPTPKGHAVPARPGPDPVAVIVNDVHLHGPAAASIDADREQALNSAIAREGRSLKSMAEGLLRSVFG